MADLLLSPLLDASAANRKPSFTLQELKSELNYSEQELFLLCKLRLLVESRPLEEVYCLSCDGTHAVHYNFDNSPYTVCVASGAGPEAVSLDRIRTLTFKLLHLLEVVGDALGAVGGVKQVEDQNLWLIGTIDLSGTRYKCYFSYQPPLEHSPHLFVSDNEGLIIFVSSTKEIITSPELVIAHLPKTIHSENPLLDRDELLAILAPLLGLMFFDYRSGRLSVGTNTIARFESQSPSYLFVKELWKASGEVVSHRDLIKSIEKKRDTDYEDAESGSRNIKRRLIDACPTKDKKEILAKLIKNGRNANGLHGYRLIRTLPRT